MIAADIKETATKLLDYVDVTDVDLKSARLLIII